MFSCCIAAEAMYVTGDFDSLTAIVQTPLLHARCFEDKLNSYNFIVRYFNAAGKHAEGLAKSRSVLSSLGEPLPDHIDNNVYASEVVAVKGLLANLSEDDLLGLPRMTDERKLVSEEIGYYAPSCSRHKTVLPTPPISRRACSS